ncbi:MULTISPECIES: SRPBCC family protein [Aeromicrobium]|uniref:SRPBCC family protein n=1 Tax=Aeromicrobium phoceense TaxID=2754045 RepID=A0A838XMN9_9ACTN|nr:MULTISPECIES: SRPBCC family protein [Aeromicrobium]MBA4608213.1 SRPBCC family protein [Aeromicrobium phoceense]
MANRDEISATIDIEAPPERVWELVSNPAHMPRWSPQCRKMIVRGKGPVGVGTTTINVNRRGPLFWPTRSKVKEFVPGKRFAFKIAENGTIWSYDLEATATGTRLTESRHAPHGVSSLSNFLTRRVLGGTENFEEELEAGIRQTLERIKAAAESSDLVGKA